MKKNIAVITGGDSSEEVISVKSAALIKNSINSNKYNSYLVYIKGNEWVVKSENGSPDVKIDKNDFSFIQNNKKIIINGAYLIIHGPPAENGKFQAYLEMLDLPYVGPRVLQASLTFNKEITKQYLSLIGIKSSKGILVRKGEQINIHEIALEIGFPCFVKPNEAGSSFGVTKIYHEDQMEDAVTTALTEDSTVLIEKFMKGIEVTCGVFKLNGETKVLPVTEIVSTKDFFDYEAKYTPGISDEITPARISEEMTKKCQETTVKIYNFLQLTGISRIDYIICNNELNLLEVNTIPGMSNESIIPKQLRIAGYNITDIITGIIDEELVSKS